MINELTGGGKNGIKKVFRKVFAHKKIVRVKIFCTFASAFCKHYQ